MLRMNNALALTGLLLATARIAGAQTGDASSIVDTWACVSAVNNGKPLPEETARALKLTLTRDRYKTERGKQVLFESTYKLDSGKKPKRIDIIATEGENEGKAAQGIYSLEGDKLTICYTMPGSERPKDFTSEPASGATLIVWKRSKK